MHIKSTCRGAHHGQLDLTLIALDSDTPIGYINYAVYEDIPSIQMIEVSSTHLRQGVASKLLAHLQSLYPTQEIEWGCLTPDGAKLKDACPTRTIQTEAKPLFDKLNRLKQRLAKMEKTIKNLHAKRQSTRAALTAYYCLERHIDDLSWNLEGQTPEKTILNFA